MKINSLSLTKALRPAALFTAAALALTLAACDSNKEDSGASADFPEVQTFTVSAGTTQTVSFTINTQWTLISDATWATFDGELATSGQAGNITLDVRITDTDQTAGEVSTANLTLTAGGKSQTIFTFYRTPEGIFFYITSVSRLYDEDGNALTDEDGNAVNDTTVVTSLTAGWDDYDSYTVFANFTYAITSAPDWLETKNAVTGGVNDSEGVSADFCCVNDPSYYKYEQTDTVVFADKTGVLAYPYEIYFPGMAADDIEIIENSGALWDWTVNKKDMIENGGEEIVPTVTFAVLNDDYVIVFADYTDPTDWKFYVPTEYDSSERFRDEDASWMSVASDDGKGTVTLSFHNTTTVNVGCVFAFSRSYYETLAEDNLSTLYDEDGDFTSWAESLVIAGVEQTWKTGDEKFGAYNGQTVEEYRIDQDIDGTTTNKPFEADISSVLDEYSPDYVGYIAYQVGISYMTTVFPVASTEEWWICDDTAVIDCDGNDCWKQTEYYAIEGGGDYYVGGTSYAGIQIAVIDDPGVDYFYAVYHDPDNDEGPTWILFFYRDENSALSPDDSEDDDDD